MKVISEKSIVGASSSLQLKAIKEYFGVDLEGGKDPDLIITSFELKAGVGQVTYLVVKGKEYLTDENGDKVRDNDNRLVKVPYTQVYIFEETEGCETYKPVPVEYDEHTESHIKFSEKSVTTSVMPFDLPEVNLPTLHEAREWAKKIKDTIASPEESEPTED